MPKKFKPSNKNSFNIPLTVICDNVREPGNLGTILRTVAGVGCSDVILTKGINIVFCFVFFLFLQWQKVLMTFDDYDGVN